MICFQVRVAVKQVCVCTLFGASSFSIAAPKTRNSLRPAVRVYVPAPTPTLYVVVSRLTISSRPSIPLNAVLLVPQIRLLSTILRVYELLAVFAVCYRPSVCRLSVCRLSFVTFVSRTQAAQIFDNISTALGTLAIHWHPLKILRRSSQGNPSTGDVKHKRGSQV